jgi:hypothetical protein
LAVHYNIQYITFTISVRETWNDYRQASLLLPTHAFLIYAVWLENGRDCCMHVFRNEYIMHKKGYILVFRALYLSKSRSVFMPEIRGYRIEHFHDDVKRKKQCMRCPH